MTAPPPSATMERVPGAGKRPQTSPDVANVPGRLAKRPQGWLKRPAMWGIVLVMGRQRYFSSCRSQRGRHQAALTGPERSTRQVAITAAKVVEPFSLATSTCPLAQRRAVLRADLDARGPGAARGQRSAGSAIHRDRQGLPGLSSAKSPRRRPTSPGESKGRFGTLCFSTSSAWSVCLSVLGEGEVVAGCSGSTKQPSSRTSSCRIAGVDGDGGSSGVNDQLGAKPESGKCNVSGGRLAEELQTGPAVATAKFGVSVRCQRCRTPSRRTGRPRQDGANSPAFSHIPRLAHASCPLRLSRNWREDGESFVG